MQLLWWKNAFISSCYIFTQLCSYSSQFYSCSSFNNLNTDIPLLQQNIFIFCWKKVKVGINFFCTKSGTLHKRYFQNPFEVNLTIDYTTSYGVITTSFIVLPDFNSNNNQIYPSWPYICNTYKKNRCNNSVFLKWIDILVATMNPLKMLCSMNF
jgi:hypothetical protein